MSKKQHLKNLFADMFCLNTHVYMVGAVIELLITGMSFEEHLHTRLVGLITVSLTARPFGLYRDFIFRKCHLNDKSKGVKSYIVDTLAYVSFKTPFYAFGLAIGGASLENIIQCLLMFVVISALIGRQYGVYRVFVRRKLFNLKTV